MEIQKLQYLNAREVWKNEAHHFTKWLAENIEYLNDKLDFNLTIIEVEKKVGSFNLDIFCEDDLGNNVLIENQLEKTDHSHLGQILTYAIGTAAKRIIWISTEPRIEHQEVIQWLNETTPVDMEWYLFKLEVIQIGDSPVSPLFTKVVGPSKELKNLGNEKKVIAERHQIRSGFWGALLPILSQKTTLFKNINPTEDNWLDARSGFGGVYYSIVIRKNGCSLKVVIDREPKINKIIFDELMSHSENIEKSFGDPMNWKRMDNNKSSRIEFEMIFCSLNKDTWEQGMPLLADKFALWEKTFKPYIQGLSKNLPLG